MSENGHLDDEFSKFQALPQSVEGKPHHDALLEATADRIRAELVSSRYRLAAVYLAASFGGYLLTLAICAQNGLSFLGSSVRSEWLMSLIPHQWCAVICGALFNGVPAITALFLLNRFQRRFLLFRLPWLLVVTPLLGCGALRLLARLDDDPSPHFNGAFYAAWLGSALLTPYLIEGFAALKLRQRSAYRR